MSRATAPRPKPVTIGALLRGERGINLLCKCGHKTSLLPAQIAAMAHPETRVLDFKRRVRCSMCGRSGAGDDIRLTTFVVAPAFAGPDFAGNGAPHRTVQ